MIDLPYTLLFGNNFITNSPLSVKMANEVLFSLGEDSEGPYLTTSIFDSTENTLIKIEKNNCIFCNEKFIKQKNQRDHVLLKDKKGEIMIESRVLDKEMILVRRHILFQGICIDCNTELSYLAKWSMVDA